MLPQLSVAVNVRVEVLPVAQSPVAVVSTIVISTFLSQLSVAVGATAAGVPQETVTFAGMLAKTGASVSRTVIT